MATRGIRNNNPGNIRKGRDKWQGLAEAQPDGSFLTFKDPVWGVRAMVRILLNYEHAGVRTVAGVIARWAPPVENDTDAYVKAVAAGVGVGANEVIHLDSAQIMLPLVKAIIVHENGSNPYPDSLIRQAIRLGGVADAPQEPLAKKMTAKALTGAGIGLGVISQAAEPAKHVADSLGGFVSAPIIQHIVTIALTLAGLAVLAGMAKTVIDHRRGL